MNNLQNSYPFVASNSPSGATRMWASRMPLTDTGIWKTNSSDLIFFKAFSLMFVAYVFSQACTCLHFSARISSSVTVGLARSGCTAPCNGSVAWTWVSSQLWKKSTRLPSLDAKLTYFTSSGFLSSTHAIGLYCKSPTNNWSKPSRNGKYQTEIIMRMRVGLHWIWAMRSHLASSGPELWFVYLPWSNRAIESVQRCRRRLSCEWLGACFPIHR